MRVLNFTIKIKKDIAVECEVSIYNGVYVIENMNQLGNLFSNWLSSGPIAEREVDQILRKSAFGVQDASYSFNYDLDKWEEELGGIIQSNTFSQKDLLILIQTNFMLYENPYFYMLSNNSVTDFEVFLKRKSLFEASQGIVVEQRDFNDYFLEENIYPKISPLGRRRWTHHIN